MAMGSEAKRLHAVGKTDEKIGFKSGVSKFEVTKSEYVSTLQSPHLFCGMMLQAYCGLIEEHARDVLRELDRIGVNVSSLTDAEYPSFEERLVGSHRCSQRSGSRDARGNEKDAQSH
jgi:hypothetical protein